MDERSRAPSDSGRGLAIFTVVACVFAVAALFWPAALRRVFVYGDLGSFLLPTRAYLAHSLARGILPLWIPNLFCGFYAHGEGQIGMVHPLRWLLYRFLPLSEAFNLECILPYPFALVGMARFARRLGLPASAAWFAGLSFAFSPYLTTRLTHLNAVAVIAHLGWLLLAIDVVLRETGAARRRAWLGVAFVTGSQLLVGYPIAIAYCWLIAIPYMGLVAWHRRELWPAVAVASSLGVGLLIGAIQLVPTWDHWTASERVAPSYEFRTAHSLHPWNLFVVVAPWLLRGRLYMDGAYNPVEQALYFGPVVPLAVTWVVLRWRRLGPFQPLMIGSCALSALALALALGQHTGIYRWLAELPLIGLLRAPARYSIVLSVVGALLAAIAFADLENRDGDRPEEPPTRLAWLWMVPGASWLVSLLALSFGDRIGDHPGRFPSELAPLVLVLLGPLVFTLAAALFTAAARGWRVALFGLVAIALADHVAYAATLWWNDPPRAIDDYIAGIESPPATPPERVATFRNFRAFGMGSWHWYCWAATRWIIRDARLVTGYAGLEPARRLDYSKPASLRVAGATVALVRLDPEFVRGAAGGSRLVPAYRGLFGALPRARLVSRAVRSAQPAIDIEAIDVANVALVDEPVDLVEGPAGVAAIEEDLPGLVRIATRADTRQLLVLSETFHPGWHVEVDGREASAIRVNGDFLGAVVEAGPHELRFRFAPRSFTLGWWGSAAGLTIALVVAFAGLTRAA